MFCKSLPTTTTGNEMFKYVDSFIIKNEINWSKCVNVISDVTGAIFGKYSGLPERIGYVAPLMAWNQCRIKKKPWQWKQWMTNCRKSSMMQLRLYVKEWKVSTNNSFSTFGSSLAILWKGTFHIIWTSRWGTAGFLSWKLTAV